MKNYEEAKGKFTKSQLEELSNLQLKIKLEQLEE